MKHPVIGYLGDTIGIQASFQYLVVGTVLGMVRIGLLFSSRIFHRSVDIDSH